MGKVRNLFSNEALKLRNGSAHAMSTSEMFVREFLFGFIVANGVENSIANSLVVWFILLEAKNSHSS